MGGFGAMSGMISSLKENRRLSHRKNDLKDKKNDKRAGLIGNPLQIGKSMTPEEKKVFQENLAKSKFKSHLVITIVFGIIFLCVIAFLFWLESL